MGTEEITPTSQATAEARAKRIKRLRNLANLSRKEIADKYQLNINTLKGWELARHGGLTEKGAKTILHILENEGVKCTLNWILYGVGEGPAIFEKPNHLASTDKSDEIQKSKLSEEEKQIINELLLFRQHNEHAIEFIVPDDSMHPYFEKGDYVAGIRRYGKDIANVVGLNCIIQTKSGAMLLRNLRAGNNNEFYTLLCLNLQTSLKEAIMHNVDLVSAAPVIWQRRRDYITIEKM
jgi:transcriptional regulator with XRE-family HTH domain